MPKANGKYYGVNIREYFLQSGHGNITSLQNSIASFSCPRNPDVERFLKTSAVEFTKRASQ